MTNSNLDVMMAELAELRLPQLQAKYAEVVGKKTRAPNRKFLLRKIREALEAQADEDSEAGEPVDGEGQDLASASKCEEADVGEGAEEEAEADVGEDAEEEAESVGDPQDATGSDAGMTESADEVVKRAAPRRKAPVRPETLAASAAASEPAAGVEAASGPQKAGGEPRLKDLDVPALQQLYVEVVGRATKSSDRRYLMWKINQARKGKVPVGPRPSRAGSGPMKVLPLRMQENLVAALDDVRKRHGLKSRMELFRAALEMYLGSLEEHEAAGLVRG